MTKEYGPVDADLSAYNYLLTLAEPIGEVNYILHYARRPVDAKHCQNPGGLMVQAVFMDNKVLTVMQTRTGELLTERNW